MENDGTLSRRRLLVRSGMAAGGAAVVAGAGLPVAYHLHHRESGPAYAARQQTAKGTLTDAEYIIQCGTLAASPHNTQPWKFSIDGARILVFADRARNLGAADPERRMMLSGVGCALENMAVAAEALGHRLEVEALQADERFERDGLCATVRLVPGAAGTTPLFPALFERQTTRLPFSGGDGAIETLRQAFARQPLYPSVQVAYARSPEDHAGIDRINLDAVQGFVTDRAQYDAGMEWYRITRAEWERAGDGIAIFTSDAPWFIKTAVELFVTPDDLDGPDFTQGEIDHVARVSAATPLWGLIYGTQASHNTRLLAGRVLERFYLEATRLGFALHPLNYAVERPAEAARLRTRFGLTASDEPLVLFRAGRATERLGNSVRRPLQSVML